MTSIAFHRVTKWYPRYHHVMKGLKHSLLHPVDTIRGFRAEGFLALDNVSFEIARGEAVGFIGANGSGKSTTLGLMAGVLAPHTGEVIAQGRVAPLLELGSGFHFDLTGRENIFINGILLGLTRRQVQERFEDIVRFSELEKFLDQPLRTYSTGMVARLAFSIAAHLDPDILLIDEILSVGDLHFQVKCRKKIDEFRRRGVTIILVSHASGDIRALCDRVIWLEAGRIAAQGPSGEVLAAYEQAQSREMEGVLRPTGT